MKAIIKTNDIQSRIFIIRGKQVMIDRDLAILYQVETRVLKQAVKRNIERFPINFMFELTNNEINLLVSQNVIPSKKYFGGAKPYAFTEQGVAMLSAVLRSETAVRVSIKIMEAFVATRKFLTLNAQLFHRLQKTEIKLLEHDKKINLLFEKFESQIPREGIFYDGQIFDAYKFISDLIRKAKKEIILIDNYIDDIILTLFGKRKKNVTVTVYTKRISKQLKLDLEKFNAQYEPIEIKKFNKSHDRFLIIDNKEIYHIGASLKDLGKKWFAFSKLNIDDVKILDKLK